MATGSRVCLKLVVHNKFVVSFKCFVRVVFVDFKDPVALAFVDNFVAIQYRRRVLRHFWFSILLSLGLESAVIGAPQGKSFVPSYRRRRLWFFVVVFWRTALSNAGNTSVCKGFSPRARVRAGEVGERLGGSMAALGEVPLGLIAGG